MPKFNDAAISMHPPIWGQGAKDFALHKKIFAKKFILRIYPKLSRLIRENH